MPRITVLLAAFVAVLLPATSTPAQQSKVHQQAIDDPRAARLAKPTPAQAEWHGERVRKYVIEGFSDGRWRPLAEGLSIGHKRKSCL